MDRKALGNSGEALAAGFLKRRGYRIVEQNFRVKTGEIDIIAKEKDTLCFVEVKTRMSKSHGSGFEAISRWKKRKLVQTALWYMKKNNIPDVNARFDVIAITKTNEGKMQMELLKNAFDVNESYL